MKKKLIWKEPILHFFILGVVVFGLKAWFGIGQNTPSNERIVEITSAEIDWFRTLFRKRNGREPGLEELRGHVNQLVREQILSSEARGLGLDKNDEVVRRRLAQKMDYLFKDMASGTQPTDLDLETYLNTNPGRYTIPGATSFDQVFFNPDRGKHEAELAADAFIKDPTGNGDVTMLPAAMGNATPAQINGAFGSEFAAILNEAETGKWFQVSSSFGIHAVYIHNHSNEFLPTTDEIRERLIADWKSENQLKTSAEAYAKIRTEYQVLVEGMPYTGDQK